MARVEGVVTGKDGLRGTLDPASRTEVDDDPYILVRLDAGGEVWVPFHVLRHEPDGSYYLPLTLAELQQPAGSPGLREIAGRESEVFVVPVVVEELDIRKRRVETGGVRVAIVVHEREEIVDEPLLQEEVSVERVPLNRVVDGPVPIRYEGNTTIVPLLEEVLVLEKRLMLKEEVRITRRQFEKQEPQRVVLRSEEARVERIEPGPSGRGAAVASSQEGPSQEGPGGE
jgi:uncharacterized protein (TIGR02271 family)